MRGSADVRTRVVCHTRCSGIELKITLTQKFLTRSLRDALIIPFLGAYNKKRPDEPPLMPEDVYALVDGLRVRMDSALSKCSQARVRA